MIVQLVSRIVFLANHLLSCRTKDYPLVIFLALVLPLYLSGTFARIGDIVGFHVLQTVLDSLGT